MGVTNFSQVTPEYDTATASASSVTLNSQSGLIITDDLTGTGSQYVLTITNNRIKAGAGGTTYALITVSQHTNTAGTAVVRKVLPSSGSMVVTLHTIDQTHNGRYAVTFYLVNPTAP